MELIMIYHIYDAIVLPKPKYTSGICLDLAKSYPRICWGWYGTRSEGLAHLAFAFTFVFAMHLASIILNGTKHMHLAMADIHKHQRKSVLTQTQTLGVQGP